MRPGTAIRYFSLRNILKKEIGINDFVLDIGGFDGILSRYISKQNKAFPVVVDLDFDGLVLAKKSGLTVVLGSATNLPFANDSIDAVMCLDLIEHLDDESALLNEVFRVLKSNGKLILTTPCETGIVFPFVKKSESEKINYSWGHKRLGYSCTQMESLLTCEGFELSFYGRYFNYFTRLIYSFLFLKFKWLPLKMLLFICAAFLEPFVGFRSQEHIFVCKK